MPFSLQKNTNDDATASTEQLATKNRSPKQKRKDDAYELAMLAYDMFKRQQLDTNDSEINTEELFDV